MKNLIQLWRDQSATGNVFKIAVFLAIVIALSALLEHLFPDTGASTVMAIIGTFGSFGAIILLNVIANNKELRDRIFDRNDPNNSEPDEWPKG